MKTRTVAITVLLASLGQSGCTSVEVEPHGAEPKDATDPDCQRVMDRFVSSAAAQGIAIDGSGDRLSAQCIGPDFSLVLKGDQGTVTSLSVEKDGVNVGTVRWSVELPGAGRFEREFVFDGDVLPEQHIRLEGADTFAETTFAGNGSELAREGDLAAALEALSPRMQKDQTVRRFYALLHTASGLYDELQPSLGERVDPMVSLLVGMPVSPSSFDPAGRGSDDDRSNTNRICAGSAAVCVAGIAGVVTGAACGPAAVTCLAAGLCQIFDCSGDGHD